MERTTIRKYISIHLESSMNYCPKITQCFEKTLVSIPFLLPRASDSTTPVRMKGKRREEILCPHLETNAFSSHDIWLLGPCVEKRREWKTRFDSRVSRDINLGDRKRGSLKVVHGCNDLAKAVRGERKGDASDWCESSKRIYSPPRSELRSQHAARCTRISIFQFFHRFEPEECRFRKFGLKKQNLSRFKRQLKKQLELKKQNL